MAAESQSPFNLADRFDAQAALERWTEARRKTAHSFLDFYEKSVGQLADAHVKSARAVDLPPVVTLAERQAEISRDVAGAYVSAARKLISD
jgi:hypothetical protein